MGGNYLEQLIAEWYEYRDYFVRRNVLVGKRARGGYECELDIVAFHPLTKHLIHIEPSTDADSWAIREKRYANKFEAGRKYIPQLFGGLDIPGEIEQIAVLVLASKKNKTTLAGGKIVLINDLLSEIVNDLKDKSVYSQSVSEQYPILRTIQFMCQYRKQLFLAFKGAETQP